MEGSTWVGDDPARERRIVDRETWRFVNSFAPWFAAFGTLTAAVVSLWLATRKNIHLQARIAAFPNASAPGGATVFASLTNHSERPVTIGNAYWRLHPWSRQIHVSSMYSDFVQKRLEDGDVATVEVPVPDFRRFLSDILSSRQKEKFSWLELFTMRFVFVTATRARARARPNKRLRRILSDMRAQDH